jgi:hypothetical protein
MNRYDQRKEITMLDRKRRTCFLCGLRRLCVVVPIDGNDKWVCTDDKELAEAFIAGANVMYKMTDAMSEAMSEDDIVVCQELSQSVLNHPSNQ